MKEILIGLGFVGLLSFVLLFSYACSSEKKGRNDAYLGRWLDLNSNTVLEIGEDKLTFTYGSMSEEFRYKMKKEENQSYFINVNGEGDFGFISRLSIREDGSIEGRENALDTRQRIYKFLREEDHNRKLEIQDLSQDAPKTIESTDLQYFELRFYNYGASYDISENWKAGDYELMIEKEVDGSYKMVFNIMGDSTIILRFSDTVDHEFVSGLVQLMKENELSLLNGYYMKNEVNRPGYSLYAEYGSGETLSINAGGDAADTCVFDIQPFLDYAAQLDLKFY